MKTSKNAIDELAQKQDMLSFEVAGLLAQGLVGECKKIGSALNSDFSELSKPSLDTSEPPVILVVDDDMDTLTVLKFLLEKEGFKVSCQRDPRMVLETPEKVPPDFILMDIMMPNLSGLELLPKLVSHPVYRSAKIIVCSSCDFERDRQAAFRLGACDFFAKPLNLFDLIGKIRTHMRPN